MLQREWRLSRRSFSPRREGGCPSLRWTLRWTSHSYFTTFSTIFQYLNDLWYHIERCIAIGDLFNRSGYNIQI